MKKIRDILSKIAKHPEKIFVNILYRIPWISKKISDERYLKIVYKSILKKELDLDNPKTFNEKLQWLKLNDRNTKYTNMVDKYEVKSYVADIVGKKYIIPTLGIWENFEDIDFDKLPNQFVLKCTHDSGGIAICKDKNSFNINKARKKLNKCLRKNFYYFGREWPYKNVKPRIIAEKYMVDESGTELKDYKFFCFNGKAKFIQVDIGRFPEHHRNFYDLDWNLLEMEMQYSRYEQQPIARPENLEEMISIAEKLSKNIPHVRVDLYSINQSIYFGELTFYHTSGFAEFIPKELNYKVGELLELPIEKNNKVREK